MKTLRTIDPSRFPRPALTADRRWTGLISAMIALAGCGNSVSTGTKEPLAPVALVTALPSVPLTTTQQAAVDQVLASGVSPQDAPGALQRLSQIQAAAGGFNQAVSQAMGIAFAAQSGVSSTALTKALEPISVTFPGSSTAVASANMDNVVTSLTGYPAGLDNAAKAQFALQLEQGRAALDLLAPAGASVASFPASVQREIAVTASLHAVRLVKQVSDSAFPMNLSAGEFDAAVTANFTPAVQAELSRTVSLALKTRALVEQTFADGNDETTQIVRAMLTGMASTETSGTVTPADLRRLGASLRSF